HHSAFEFDTLEQLLIRYETLKTKGIVPHACLDHGLTTSFYYEDPDGNSVELQADNFGDWAASTEWVRNAPEFVANPIGVYVDPDLMLGAHREGSSADELHRRGYAGEFAPATPQDLHLPEPAVNEERAMSTLESPSAGAVTEQELIDRAHALKPLLARNAKD